MQAVSKETLEDAMTSENSSPIRRRPPGGRGAPVADRPIGSMTALRILFLFVATLCWTNAIMIAGNGLVAGGGGSVLGVSLTVALIYATIGLLIFLVQRHLLRALSLVPAREPASASLGRLAICLAAGAAALGLVMLTSLWAITQRMLDGYAIFG